MMAFFMHFYKNNHSNQPSSLRSAWFCLLTLVLSISLAWASNSSLNIKSAELVPLEDSYALNADVDLHFSDAVQAAINKGVALHFLVECQITAGRKYWFDDEIVTMTREVSISYHALSRQYLLNIDNVQQAFSSLSEAKAEFSRIHHWKIIEKSELSKDESYTAALRVRLNQSKLPKPLQVEALSSDQWNMISERYKWTPAFN
jgi:Domain of unknown function (DUF4390)